MGSLIGYFKWNFEAWILGYLIIFFQWIVVGYLKGV